MSKESSNLTIKLGTKIFISTLSLAWLALFLSILRQGYNLSWIVVLFWGIFQFTLESLQVKLKKGATTSVTFATIFAAIILFGPLIAGTIALFQGVIWQDLFNRESPSSFRWLFNSMQHSISAITSGLAYQALGGIVFLNANSGFTLSNFASQILPLIGAIGVFYIVNTLFVSLAISINEKISITDLWKLSFSWGDLNYLALGFLGIIFAQIYYFEPLALILLFIPLAIARQTFLRYMQLEDAYSSTIAALIRAIETKDPYTKGHSERVASLSAQIGKHLKLGEKDIESLKRIASLHDIGKIGVPKRILIKPGKLSEDEFQMVKQHPRIGARILKDVSFLRDLIPAIYYHHEKIDGSGYNSGLIGNNIPLFARIIALADSYDAMTSDRGYRKALPKQQVIEQLQANAGTQFDKSVVQATLKIVGTAVQKKETPTPVLISK